MKEKGIMLWGKMTALYNELTMGQNGNKNINGVGHNSRGFNKPRLIGYAESHDEERLMYKNIQYGASNGSYNIQDLNTALSRMSALELYILQYLSKMIWHFGELGMENSIYTCDDETVDTPSDAIPGDCKLILNHNPNGLITGLEIRFAMIFIPPGHA